MSEWTAPADVEGRIATLWNRGRILAASLSEEPMFPLVMPMRQPNAKALATRFEDVRAWIRELERGSKAVRGFGYEIVWDEWEHRQLGRNRVPGGIRVETEDDALRLIGKQRDAERFRRLAAATTARFPMLHEWLVAAPLTALDFAGDWDRTLAVLEWFRDHPRSGLYLRQLDISGVDTKFVGDRRGILSALLDRVLPADAIDATLSGSRNFEGRYGLRCKPALVRFRTLDSRLRVNGISDMSVPVSEFTRLDVGARRVFITENELNGISFPDVPDSIVVFGLGYGVELLASCDWMKTKDVFYWGDIDTHGFAILDRLRGFFPHARSLLMDRETLSSHRDLWVVEAGQHDKPLARLSDAECALYDDLLGNRLGDRVRLEQERVAFSALERALAEIAEMPPRGEAPAGRAG